MNFSVLILLIAIILFGVLAFRQMSALILAPVVTIFVIVLSGMPILDTLLQHFMPATSDYITKYFLIFFVGALFGAVYQFTGAAESIARTMGCFCGNHFVAPMIMCITGLLTFGGVSGFVVFYICTFQFDCRAAGSINIEALHAALCHILVVCKGNWRQTTVFHCDNLLCLCKFLAAHLHIGFRLARLHQLIVLPDEG